MNKGTIYTIIFMTIAIIAVVFIAYKSWGIVLTFIVMGIVALSGMLKK